MTFPTITNKLPTILLELSYRELLYMYHQHHKRYTQVTILFQTNFYNAQVKNLDSKNTYKNDKFSTFNKLKI